ncbi:MAG: hypothetical protein CEN89_581 [Candidatus Berkelbacteria bacterium Licking1014_7]|uniref:Uncharacterized protein n=1 Tax=Candidatus Berkelbacteria bacterium Licking1014_7 TaxID=2017147 RepID=A0A554LIH7_9BACT|nr:MAG: hypothetical protein CEN89_581 [Candidatus Berkelbacteria bacterium Licking1014_7]
MQFTQDHIIGAIAGFLIGYVTGVFTSKLLKIVMGTLVLGAAVAYVYYRYLR